MGTVHLLQKTLERLNEAKTEHKCIELQQNRATLDLLQTLERLNYVKIFSNKNKIIVETTKSALAFGETKIAVVEKKNLRAEAAKRVPSLVGTLLVYTRRGVIPINRL